MPNPSGNNKTNKNHRNTNKNLRRLTADEKKARMGSAPNPAKTVYNIVKNAVNAHTKIHKNSKGVRDATRSMNPGRKV
tara:strand:+ start:3954 stop:4187 length:234 start_codon:yes stop_codon:yes gene_type:complete